jgi:hypothetical protein
MKRMSEFMSNLMVGCLSRLRESEIQNWDFFEMAGYEMIKDLSFLKTDRF